LAQILIPLSRHLTRAGTSIAKRGEKS
jgi:hypothetical protein